MDLRVSDQAPHVIMVDTLCARNGQLNHSLRVGIPTIQDIQCKDHPCQVNGKDPGPTGERHKSTVNARPAFGQPIKKRGTAAYEVAAWRRRTQLSRSWLELVNAELSSSFVPTMDQQLIERPKKTTEINILSTTPFDVLVLSSFQHFYGKATKQ